jgi:cellulose synthase/poly-beta-1,6-N-acetylglucosamine synthase-like glycosyltransferase
MFATIGWAWGALYLAFVASIGAIGIVWWRVQASLQAAPRLTPLAALPTSLPTISVIVPAYNEATNIEACVRSVLASTLPHPERLQVIVADDESSDATFALASALQASDPRLTVFTVAPRPADSPWRGKNWACTQAVKQATGEFWLFIDADVRLEKTAIATTLNDLQLNQADLLSCGPRIVCECLAEWLVQPIMMLLIAIGFNFDAVNDPTSDTAFAAGPFMLFRRSAYEAIGGHQGVAADPLEDVALARQIKQQGLKLRYLLGLDQVSVRMYPSLAALWEGWTKNYYLGADRNIFGTLYSVLAVNLVYVLPWVGMALALIGIGLTGMHLEGAIALGLAGVAIAAQFGLRWSCQVPFSLPLRYWWLASIGGTLVSAIAITSILKVETGIGWTWRGRSLAAP